MVMQGKQFGSAEEKVLVAVLSSAWLGRLGQFRTVSCQEVE